MVRIFLSWVLIFLTSFYANAAEFLATVESSNLYDSQEVVLTLQLSGVSVQSKPDISVLEKDFDIIGESSTSGFSFGTGGVNSEYSWRYNLIPKNSGAITIPPIKIDTSQGVLSSNEVTINVEKQVQNSADEAPGDIVTIEASVSDTKPYINEAIIYKVKIFNRSRNFGEATIGIKPSDDLIIEKVGESKLHSEVIDGESVQVSETNYSIVPLRHGKITIPPVSVQGKIRFLRKSRPNHFDQFKGFGLFSNLTQKWGYKDFKIESKPATINVRPANDKIEHWLPLRSLKISEVFDKEQEFVVGKPISRTITLVAQGTDKEQLPNIEEMLHYPQGLKFYADKPEKGSQTLLDKNTISAWVSQSFTIIAQQPGTYQLPPLEIKWWDVKSHKVRLSKLPSREIIVGGVSAYNSPVSDQPEASDVVAGKEETSYLKILIYVAIVLFAVILGLLLYKGKKPLIKRSNAAELSLSDISEVADFVSLKNFIQRYAEETWQTEKNLPLSSIANIVGGNFSSLFDRINESIYGKTTHDLSQCKSEFIKAVKAKKNTTTIAKHQREQLMLLNP